VASPVLEHINAADGESDNLTYSYEVYDDAGLTNLITQAGGQLEGSGSSSWTVDISLTDDMVYYWRVMGNDGYEDGLWSAAASFWVNADNQVPTAFDLVSPADGILITEPNPVFDWTASSESDLYDTLSYSFVIDTTAAFTSADTIADLTDTSYAMADSTSMGMGYYWKVLAVDQFGGVTQSSQVFMFSTLVPGDANGDGLANVGDAVYIINYVFGGGPPPDPLKSGDVNEDCTVDVGDAVYLINFIFREGPAPNPGCAK
jgi:hypothetical protein